MNIKKVFSKESEGFSAFTRPYIIAEVGVNHEGSMDTAKHLVDLAKDAGADAVKFQTYRADTLAVKNSPAYWDTSQEKTLTQHSLFLKHEGFWKNEMEQLKIHCDSVGIDFMSTPFDTDAALFLNDLMEVFKISSSDITNKPLIEFIASFEKPILLSTGASNLDEIREAVGWIHPFNNHVALMHCVLNYPTAEPLASLGMIRGLQNAFPELPIGYSDHTQPGDLKVVEVAALLGSRIIEKHFTQDKSLPGNDHYHSMDVNDLNSLARNLDRLESLIGNSTVRALPEEDISRLNARRSLVATKKIKKGTKIEAEHLTCKRPARGISPKDIDAVVGKTAKYDIDIDTPLMWTDIDG